MGYSSFGAMLFAVRARGEGRRGGEDGPVDGSEDPQLGRRPPALPGSWPTASSGRVRATASERWRAIDEALRYGRRGLPGGSSLGLLLAAHRGLPPPTNRQPLTVEQILRWADAHRQRTGQWPSEASGSVPRPLRRTGGSSTPLFVWGHVRCRQALAWPSPFRGEGRSQPHQFAAPDHRADLALGRRPPPAHWPVARPDFRTRCGVSRGKLGPLTLAVRNGYRGLPRGSTLHSLLEGQEVVAPHNWEEVIERYRAGEALNRLARLPGGQRASVRQFLRRRGILRRGSR